ncbi:GntR family transcriptional regulator [Alkalihalobacillus trypoxylicola]|uniref:GntR family transcriptional regulator n=1 Tax=Alkalihalobacillus trypoxylicola TaxID=519424 RepID=A0A162CTM8_9BACI|nr:GntR family transcriptional regulator [Alkalihalobacillus trypoxylicola]KYG26603.1 GntR family transcriptional regulator [Alkalihalobacillus trypoxylicola]GAF64185.1 putative transcriptional regulator [Bacillus sp. TS-2]
MISTEIKRTNGSTRDFVYHTIKAQIINWELKPGTKISEKEVATQLKVSRTPVREAFLMLAHEELLGVYPQSGTIVSHIDLALVEEGRFVRQQIERAIVEEVCLTFNSEQLFKLESNLTMQELCLEKGSHQRLFELDEEYHRIMFEGCNKVRTWNMIRQMNSHFDRLRVLRLVANTDWDGLVSQHKRIFEYICQKDIESAVHEMSIHLERILYEKDELKKLYPDYFL